MLKAVETYLLSLLPDRVQSRLRRTDNTNKAIVRSIFWLLVFVVGAKGIAAIKEVAIAYRYGTSATLEGYLLVFNMLSTLISVVYSVMHFVLVPELVRRRQQAPADARAWQRGMTAWVWLMALVLAFLAAAVLPDLIKRGWLGLSGSARDTAMDLLPTMAVIVAIGIVAAWHACQLMSHQRHANTFLEAMPSLGILVATLLMTNSTVQPLLWGTLAGFGAQAVLTAWAAHRAGSPITPGALTDDAFGSAHTTTGWVLAAQLLMSSAAVVDQIVLAHASPGSLAAFGYANRVIALVLTLTATVLGRALLPVLSAIDDEAHRLALTRRWAMWAFWAGLAATGLLMGMADWLVQFLFERGAFTHEDREWTAQILRLLSLQWPFYLVMIVWIQWALTQPKGGRTMWRASASAVIGKFVALSILIKVFDSGAEGVCIGILVSILIYSLMLIYENKFIKNRV